MAIPWKPVEVFPESALAWEVTETSWDEGEWFCQVRRVRFSGVYRPGSAGSPDAGLMMAVTAAALARDSPDVVLFDLAELDYRWGDGLLGVFQVVGARDAEHPVECVVVAGEACIGAVRSLAGGAAASGEWLFESVEAAWPRVVELAVARSRAIG
jgi:hypothetical protein